jgi:L-lactate dehydrogenase
LRLLDKNAKVYRQVIPLVNAAARDAVLLVVTDPPDPLAYLTRELAGHDRVLSTGTLLDGLRFRMHLGRKLKVAPTDIEAQVLGEHGTSQIFHWSGARVGGVPISDALEQSGLQRDDDFHATIEKEVRYANIKLRATLSLPSVVGREGWLQVLDPPLSNNERIGLKNCIETLRNAQERIR